MTSETSITRVVKLTIHPANIQKFKDIFIQHQQHIAQFNGCLELKAYQDSRDPRIFFTISRWQSQENLDEYRFSAFFKELWPKVKPLFDAPAEAHSLTLV